MVLYPYFTLNLLQNVAAPQIWPRKWIFLAMFTMWSGVHAKKFNTRGEFELELAANGAEPENQAGLVPGPDPVQIK